METVLYKKGILSFLQQQYIVAGQFGIELFQVNSQEITPMKTRAAVAFKAGQPLEIVEVDLQGPQAGEVLVEIKATGICHTDAFTLSGDDPEGAFPAILGHEGAGVVVEVGAGVTSVKPCRGTLREVGRAVPRDGTGDGGSMAIRIVRKKRVGGSAVHGQDLTMTVVDRQRARRRDALRHDRVPGIIEET